MWFQTFILNSSNFVENVGVERFETEVKILKFLHETSVIVRPKPLESQEDLAVSNFRY